VTYTAAAVVGVIGAVTLDLWVLRTKLIRGRLFWATYPIVAAFQLLSNGVLTGRGVVRYDPAAIVGLRIVYAPVEDLAFGFALVLAALALWVWWGRRGVDGGPPSALPVWLTRIRAALSRRVGSRPRRGR
jgi:lycopene cyclase domain-containing protein